MEITVKMKHAIYNEDLIVSAMKLIVFAQSALQEKYRAPVVKQFYEELYQHGLTQYAANGAFNNQKRYVVYDGSNAVNVYLALAMPKQESPVKALNNIRAFGEQILTSFVKPVGPRIQKSKIYEIMEYLDSVYHFSQKVFSDRKAIILDMDYSNKNHDGECLTERRADTVTQHIFLYCMNDPQSAFTPEAVFFRELGHALLTRYILKYGVVPAETAEMLGTGLMADSPFSECIHFTGDVNPLKMRAEEMLSAI